VLALDTAIDDYLLHLKVERRLRPNSLAAYAQDLRELAAFLIKQLGDPVFVAAVGPPQLVAYLGHASRTLAARSQARRLVAMRGLFRHLRQEGAIAVDPTQGLSAPRLAKKLPTLLTRDEVDRLLAAPGADTPLALRDTAILELLYASGCRISEALELTLDRLYLDQAVVRLIGKGDKPRLVPLGTPAVAALHAWIRDGRPSLPPASACARSCSSTSAAPPCRVRASSLNSATTRSPPASPAPSPRTSSATASPPTCSRAAPTCAPSRPCSATPTSRPRRSTPTSPTSTSAPPTASTTRARSLHP
jgi:site-specific recombinase XerD